MVLVVTDAWDQREEDHHIFHIESILRFNMMYRINAFCMIAKTILIGGLFVNEYVLSHI